MKDNYNELNLDMEQLLFSKEFDDLTASELEEIKDVISSREDFYLMKNTLMSVKTSFNQEAEIEPDASTKEELLKLFEKNNGKVIPFNPTRPFYMNPFFQVGVAAVFILGIVYFYPKGNEDSLTAINNTESNEENNADKSDDKTNAATEENEKTDEDNNAEAVAEEVPEKEAEAVASVDADVVDDVTVTRNESNQSTAVLEPTAGKTKANEFKPDLKDVSGEGKDDKPLFSSVERTSAEKKEEAKAEGYLSKNKKKDVAKKSNEDIVLAEDETTTKADGTRNLSNATTTFNSSPTTVATGSTFGGIVADNLAVNNDKSERDEKMKDSSRSDNPYMRPNSAGGYYFQPGKPVEDLKAGESLKDNQGLSEFLFTAL